MFEGEHNIGPDFCILCTDFSDNEPVKYSVLSKDDGKSSVDDFVVSVEASQGVLKSGSVTGQAVLYATTLNKNKEMEVTAVAVEVTL